MTKAELIELVKEKLSGGDAPAQIAGIYHPVVISKYLEIFFNDSIFAAYMLGEKTGDYSQVDNYLQRYFYAVKTNSIGQKYVDLDVQPVPLPNSYGIRQVSAKHDDLNVVFAPVDPVANQVFNKLEVNFVDPTPGYSYEGNQLWFDNRFPFGLENIMVKMITGFNELKPKDQVFVPGGNTANIINGVFQLMVKPPKVNEQDMTTKQV